MADFPATGMIVTAIAGSSGAARIQTYLGNSGNQTQIMVFELTAAQNSALQTALAASAGTATTFTFPQLASDLVGTYPAY